MIRPKIAFVFAAIFLFFGTMACIGLLAAIAQK